jgi:DNA polymerase III subunit epsilon
MREIVIDTETTGLDPRSGDRIVEIAAVELVNHLPTGRVFHHYLNPERDMSEDAFAVHGLSTAFLADKPRFAEIAEPFIAFIEGARLVIHNAEFDIAFINAELGRVSRPSVAREAAIDTLALARQKFPGSPASLDALCRRFTIDNTARTRHGALLDAELLSEVYLELIGGRQAGFDLATTRSVEQAVADAVRHYRPARPHAPSLAELAAHAALVARLKEPVWLA